MVIGSNYQSEIEYYYSVVTLAKTEVTDNPISLIYSIDVANVDGDVGYLHLFDADADNVTVATTVADIIILVPILQPRHLVFPKPIRFGTGFTLCASDAVAATGAHNLNVIIGYTSGS